MRTLPDVLMLDINGSPRTWIDYEKSAYYYAKELVAWDMGATYFTLHGGTSRMTGKPVTMSINTIIAIKGKVSSKVVEKFHKVRLTNQLLFKRDLNVCAYCGHQFKFADLTRDHIHPVSKNGKDVWTNVVTACKSCNRRKDNHLLYEIGWELLYVPYAPSKFEELILRSRNILADQMEFLLAQVPENSRLKDDKFKQFIIDKGYKNQWVM